MKERAYYIDAVKGVAILCITFLHFEYGIIPSWLNTWIGMFMITTFYFTSGWVSGMQNRTTSTKELAAKRIKQLGIPYLWFSALIILFNIIWCICGFMDYHILLRDIYKTLTLRGIGTLWFLPALLIGEIIFCYIKNSKRKWLLTFVALILTIMVMHIYNNVWQPLRGESLLNKIIDAPIQPIVWGLKAWPIIAVGYIFAKHIWPAIIKCRKYIIILFALITISFSISLIITPYIYIYYLNSFLSNILPVIGFACLFYATDKTSPVTNFFTFWGVNSLVLMCTHFSITQEILKTIDEKFIHSGFCGVITITYFVITIIVTYPLVGLFNNRLRFMIGK